MSTSEDLGYSRFDRDPDALAWARSHVQREIDRMRRFEEQARRDGSTDPRQWFKFGNLLDRRFIGGEGCVIAAFDSRKPSFLEALDASRPAEAGDF